MIFPSLLISKIEENAYLSTSDLKLHNEVVSNLGSISVLLLIK